MGEKAHESCWDAGADVVEWVGGSLSPIMADSCVHDL